MSLHLIASVSLVWAATPARPNVSTLTPAQQNVFERVASEEFCSCNSALTLSGCLQLKPDCRVANHVSRLVYMSAQANLGPDEILGYLANRVTGPYCAAPKAIDPTQAPAKGPANAPITLVEFADFRCGHCKQAAPVVHRAVKRYADRVRFVFIPFPLQNHPLAIAAAEAALAAHAQGKFWQMHDALFAAQSQDFGPQVLNRLAKQVGLDVARFSREMAGHTHRATVEKLRQQGLRAGIQATPSLFVNGRAYDLDPTLFTLQARFDMELDRSRGKCQ